ncbi:MAG: glycosyltransferase family 4 protein [Actinomycetia bacterium]|nr:glycosyltransferase family 4 protein [Actinomycetes bacterium]
MTRALRIAMIGCRGVPATYGGIERHVEEIGARLVERGHHVTVFNRPGYAGEQTTGEHRGMRVVVLPAVGTKHLEAISHSGLAALHAVRHGYDIYHFHALGPGLFAALARGAGRGRVVLTVHGLDFQRAKWNSAAAWCIRHAETVAVRSAHGLVVVAPELVGHYRSTFGVEATFIRNGVTARHPSSRVPGDPFVLFVGRLTPEKGPHLLLEAFRRIVDPHLRLVVVGGSSHTDDYVADLERAARTDPRVDLRGYVFGQELTDLYAGARLFVQPSSLEGMPLTVLEAAACGAPLLTSDIAVHGDMLAPPGPGRRLFPVGSVDGLESQLRTALGADPADERAAARAFGEQILLHYSWDDVAEELEQAYLRVVERTGPVVST